MDAHSLNNDADNWQRDEVSPVQAKWVIPESRSFHSDFSTTNAVSKERNATGLVGLKEDDNDQQAVSASKRPSDYHESLEQFLSHNRYGSNDSQDWSPILVADRQVPEFHEIDWEFVLLDESDECPIIEFDVDSADVEMKDEMKENGTEMEGMTEGLDKQWSTYTEYYVPMVEEDVRMDSQSAVHAIASSRVSAQPQTALHPDASLHAGHGQEGRREHFSLATNPPRVLPPATRLPSSPPLVNTRLSQQLYRPPLLFYTNKMDDCQMDDDTQVTQTAPPQQFTQPFQAFQHTTNSFGWGQITQSQPQSQPQPFTNPFSFNPPVQVQQFSDPNEAAAYNFWFTMLAKIREQEMQNQQQQPMTTTTLATAPTQFLQPPRPFTPMFDLPSQPDGRPLVQGFSDEPPSPRFGGLRFRRSRRIEDRGFDPFHIGCGMKPPAPSFGIEGDIRVRGSEANLIHRLALEKRLEEEAKQRAARERQIAEQTAQLVKDAEKKRKSAVKKRRRNSSSRRSIGENSLRKSKLERRGSLDKSTTSEKPTEDLLPPSSQSQVAVSRPDAIQEFRRVKRQIFCPTFSMAIQRFIRTC